MALEGEQGILDMELIREDGPFLSVGLQREASRDALDDAIESGPSAPEGEGSQDDDSPSTKLQQVGEENDILKQRICDLETQLGQVTVRMKSLWRANCSLSREFEEAIGDKDAEVEHLRQQLVTLQGEAMSGTCTTSPVDSNSAGVTPSVALHGHERPTHKRKGKAPPVDSFSGEDEAVRLDDWIPTLKRAATWNDWSEGDLLLQLAGHLRGRALQEWDLIPEDIKSTFRTAVDALRDRLDPGGRMLVVQDFRHAAQKSEESVADFIRRLEHCFRVAYGRDNLGKEAQEALLHGQFQEGLRMELMKSPSVSGAQSYPTLCLAAKNEERHLAQLKKRQRYKDTLGMQQKATQASQLKFNPRQQLMADERKSTSSSSGQTQKKCYTCGSTKHLQRDCTMSSTESKSGNQKPSQTCQVIVISCDDPRTYQIQMMMLGE